MSFFRFNKPIRPLFGLLAAILLLTACGGVADKAATPLGDQSEAVRTALLQSDDDASDVIGNEEATCSDRSLYLLDSWWFDQSGRRVKLASLQGEPVVLAMVFTHCGSACPMIVHDMKEIAERLPERARLNVRFVLVSLDPERDTPEALSRFAQAHRLDPAHWLLLSGKGTDVRTLAAALGVRYREEADGQIMHANVISFLNEKGEVVYRQEGLGSDPTVMAGKLRSLLEGRS
ncbi:MAG TPA: SCO family protein [Rhodothermales bacterium]|nr:SCO family protein [Rhodothermales bacterium]